MSPAPCITPARAPSALSLPSTRRAVKGFTLVEILTATAIMALIISLVMVVLDQVLNAWNLSTDDLTYSTNARFVFDALTQDLQGCILRSDGNQWFSLTTDQQGSLQSPIPAIQESRLIFFTSTPMHQSKDSSTPGGPGHSIAGDICAVEYRVVYADPFGTATPGGGATTNTYSLHRVVIDPASTFYGVGGDSLMGLNANTTPTGLAPAFDAVIDLPSAATVPNDSVTPVPVAIPNVQNGEETGPTQLTVPIYGAYSTASTLLDNVAQFNVFVYFTGQDTTQVLPVQTYPQSYNFKTDPPSIYYGGAATAGAAGYLDGQAKPVFISLAFADVTLTILTDEGVTNLQQGNGALPEGMTWPQYLQKYGKTYTQRIPLLVKPH
jgi:prepilin-type N-terminal cleavage/methylation domain-containing protein